MSLGLQLVFRALAPVGDIILGVMATRLLWASNKLLAVVIGLIMVNVLLQDLNRFLDLLITWLKR